MDKKPNQVPSIPAGSKYKGKPENFNPDFKHPNAGKKSSGKPGPKADKLPPPSNPQGMKNPTPTKDEPIFKDAIFGPEIIVRENDMRTRFQPTLASLMEIVQDMWMEMRVDENQIDKQMLVEGLRYYVGVLAWLRIVQLKRANNMNLTSDEQQLLDICETTQFNVPEPVFLYLKSIGTIQTASTGQTLIPEFPNMPNQIINNHGGYFGPIDEHNHNLYEEIPSLGVLSEALRNALSDANPGRYNSALDTENVQVNNNLLGFAPLTNRRPEAKNFFLNIGVTADRMVETIPNTGFNYEVVYAISNWLANNKTFKNQSVNFNSLGTNGSQSQIVIQRPVVRGITSAVRNVNGEIRETTLSRENSTTFGIGYFVELQLFKESAINAIENESVRARTWCCQNFTGADINTTIPNGYIENRNIRRNIPQEYLAERFESISMRAGDLRKRTLNLMVIASR